MFEHGDRIGRRSVGIAARCFRNATRVGVTAAALTAITAVDLPRLPLIGLDLGATSAIAKNERSSERSSERGRGGRGRGHDRRSVLLDTQGSGSGRRVWNQPRDHADHGRHSGRDRSAATERSVGWNAAEEPPLPPRHPDSEESDFRNHGQRVSTYVALAKELGLSASTGSMQANFGTPFENGLVATDPDTGEFLTDPDTGEFIIDATEADIAAAKPGNGPKTGWETETGLDVNMDGIVDGTDLDLAQDPDGTSNGEDDGQNDDDPADGDNDNGDGQAAILRIGREDGEVPL